MPPRLIRLRAPSGVVDWTIVELQGSIGSRDEGASLDGVALGSLKQLPNGAVTLQIGNGLSQGRWEALKKPLAVMRKAHDADAPSTSYHAVGVVRNKLVFKDRPTPITRALAPAADNKRARQAQST